MANYFPIALGLLLVLQILSAPLQWEFSAEFSRGLIDSAAVYTLNTSSSPWGTKLTGSMISFNMNDTRLEFLIRDTNGDALGYFPKTPIEYAEAEENVVYAVINGGYFDMVNNVSASFLAESSRVKSKNGINEGTNVHPTVGAFGMTSEGKFETEYIYSYGSTMETYKFAYPNHFPGPVANPDDGVRWNVKEGIGAGPILLKNTSIIGGNLENFGAASMINMRHPRSVICNTAKNQLLLVAIDGRYPGSDGLTIPETAQLMQSLNCFNAMNLDGGGSTLLYANGHVTNRPSDATGPRKVVSAVLVRDRTKRKL